MIMVVQDYIINDFYVYTHNMGISQILIDPPFLHHEYRRKVPLAAAYHIFLCSPFRYQRCWLRVNVRHGLSYCFRFCGCILGISFYLLLTLFLISPFDDVVILYNNPLCLALKLLKLLLGHQYAYSLS